MIALDKGFYESALNLRKEYLEVHHTTRRMYDPPRMLGRWLESIVEKLWKRVVCKVFVELKKVGVPEGSRVW